MNKNELEILTQKSCEIVTETAAFIRSELGKVKNQEIETKALNSLVSYVDKSAEERLVKGFLEILPESTFLTEEETIDQKEGDYQWIIDPLDGTTNFLHQLPCFAVSVALRYKKEIVLGIVYEVNRSECFYAWKGGGAYLNGKAIHVSKTTNINDSLIATGFPYYDYEREESYFKAFKYFMHNTRGIRRFGAAAVDLVWVACGRFDAFFEYSLNPWDVAAGIIIVQEAGGKVYDFKGANNYLFGKEMVATNSNLSEKFMNVIKESFSS